MAFSWPKRESPFDAFDLCGRESPAGVVVCQGLLAGEEADPGQPPAGVVQVQQGRQQLCTNINISSVADPDWIHIHEGKNNPQKYKTKVISCFDVLG
jgi:hypothetical protein